MTENKLYSGGYDPYLDPACFISGEMEGIFDMYANTLSTSQREAFVELKDISRRVNGICYEWAEVGGQLREQAVCLRSLHIVRALDRFIHSGNKHDVRDYHSSGIVPGDDFWPRVEVQTYSYLERLMMEMYNTTLKPEPPVENVNGRTKQRLAKALGYEVGRYIFRNGDRLAHFAYIAAHKKRKEFRSRVV